MSPTPVALRAELVTRRPTKGPHAFQTGPPAVTHSAAYAARDDWRSVRLIVRHSAGVAVWGWVPQHARVTSGRPLAASQRFDAFGLAQRNDSSFSRGTSA